MYVTVRMHVCMCVHTCVCMPVNVHVTVGCVCTIACMWNSEENFSGVDSLPPCFYHSAYSKTVALAFPADVPISVSFLCSHPPVGVLGLLVCTSGFSGGLCGVELGPSTFTC